MQQELGKPNFMYFLRVSLPVKALYFQSLLNPPFLPSSPKQCAKRSLLSSHQSAGIWSMPRSLCAAKWQIKETVISSAASAADSYAATAVCASGAEEERRGTLQQSVEWENQGGSDEGEEKDGATHRRSTPWYKVLQLSQTLWRETQSGRRWGQWQRMKVRQKITRRIGVTATLKLQETELDTAVWLNCANSTWSKREAAATRSISSRNICEMQIRVGNVHYRPMGDG